MPAGDSIRAAADAAAAAALAIQTAAENIENGSVSFAQVKDALTGFQSAIAPHGEATGAMVALLIDQSNFSGEEQ